MDNPYPLKTGPRPSVEDKGPGVQGAPKQIDGKETAELQALATSHSQQHGMTLDSHMGFMPVMKADIEQEEDYERNT